MRKITQSFLPYLLLTALLNLTFSITNAQVPVFGPETFGTEGVLPAGWTVVNPSQNNNTWEMVKDVRPSSGYSNPNASGGSHIKIDASARPEELLISPVINCTGVTNGELRFGVWRAQSYTRTLIVRVDITDNGSSTYVEYRYTPSKIPFVEKWGLFVIPLGTSIDNKASVQIRFSHTGASSSGPLRIDDITLYGNATIQPEHFRTKASGDWANPLIWESSPDNAAWKPATIAPNSVANTITIRPTHSVTNTSALTVDQLTINNGGTLVLAHDLTLNDGTGEDLVVDEGGLLDFSAYRITTAGIIQLNGHLKTANPEGLYGSPAASIATGVGLNVLGTNSVIEYNANGNQWISTLSSGYANLTISGSGNKSLAGTTSIANNLVLNGGFLVLADHNLTVGNTATGSAASYIKVTGTGKLAINSINGSAKTFPIGNSSYNPVTITGGSGLKWTVGIEDVWVISDPVLGASSDKAVLRTWSIVPFINPPPAAADILLEYDDSDPAQVGSEFDQQDLVQVWRQAASDWLAAGVTQQPGGTANGRRTVTLSSDAYFSRFAISNMDTPLPVRFRDVRALQKQSVVWVYFTNETEGGVEDYTLERSADGQTFSSLQTIKPLKNNGTSVGYEVKDEAPLDGQNLYRIKARARTGRITYSVVVGVKSNDGSAQIIIVPNPADKGAVSLRFTNVPEDNYKLTLYNAKGQLMLHRELYHAGGSASYPLPIDQLQPGTYIIELTGKEKLLQRFVVL